MTTKRKVSVLVPALALIASALITAKVVGARNKGLAGTE